MSERSSPLKLLVLCTGNSARSILGEAIANRQDQGRIAAWSAGSYPKGQVHPQALGLLARRGYPTEGLRSKSWDEFTGDGAPVFDAVITVCDNAAGETCPVWLGHPVRVHWGMPDPAAATGDEAARAFEETYQVLKSRIDRIARLPLGALDPLSLKRALDEIGQDGAAAHP
jgi:protein-tyrosine-phosphatase